MNRRNVILKSALTAKHFNQNYDCGEGNKLCQSLIRLSRRLGIGNIEEIGESEIRKHLFEMYTFYELTNGLLLF